jgi:hypothetical protein
MKVTTIRIDLAKDVFGLHGVDGEGRVTFDRWPFPTRASVPTRASATCSYQGISCPVQCVSPTASFSE